MRDRLMGTQPKWYWHRFTGGKWVRFPRPHHQYSGISGILVVHRAFGRGRIEICRMPKGPRIPMPALRLLPVDN